MILRFVVPLLMGIVIGYAWGGRTGFKTVALQEHTRAEKLRSTLGRCLSDLDESQGIAKSMLKDLEEAYGTSRR